MNDLTMHKHGHHHAHAHAHGHHRHHHHAHGHHHAPSRIAGWRFALATVLNLALVLAQVISGLQAHSVSLLADAGHNFGDVMGLLLAWGAVALGNRKPTPRYTYGFRSASILASLANSVLLLVATGIIAREALDRLLEPAPVEGGMVMTVAAIGILINGFSAALLMGNRNDINVRGAFLHLLADAAISGGVVLSGAAILLSGWNWIDPAVSLLISAIIVWGSWGILREAMSLSLQAVPAGVDPGAVRLHLEKRPGVAAVHDLHIWAMSTTENALTCHLVMPGGHPGDSFLHELSHDLGHHFGIGHCTFQIEMGEPAACALAPDHVV